VGLKKVSKLYHPTEVAIGNFFSSEPRSSNADNHCVPIYDVLQVPEEESYVILVMPFLRQFKSPRFGTIGEAVDFFDQALRGMQFMHKHHVAHRFGFIVIFLSSFPD
jgi:serine/threonine protein kinase